MNPIVIVGAGLAGLAASAELRRLQLPFVLVDEEATVGGRCATVRGDGWLGDPAVPWVMSADAAVLDLIRAAGLEAELIAFQGPALRHRDGQMIPMGGGSYRMLRDGFGSLFDRWLTNLPRPVLGTFVAAIRWIGERQLFLFRDGRTGATLSHPISRARVQGSGVILALPPRRAATLAAQSRVLLPSAEALAAMPAQPGASGIFVVPRFQVPWSALVVEDHWAVTMLVREEAKGPGRVDEDKSVIVVRATPAVANARYENDCRKILYDAAREFLPMLPAEPMDGRVIGWEEGMAAAAIGLVTDPPGAPLAVAMEAGPGSSAERLAQAGMRAAREVAAKLG